MSTLLRVKRGLRFKDGDISFCVKERIWGKPGKIWLVQSSIPGAGWGQGGVKPPMEMTEDAIIELVERYMGDNAVSDIKTTGARAGSTMKTPPRFLAVYERRRIARATLA